MLGNLNQTSYAIISCGIVILSQPFFKIALNRFT